MSATTPAIVAAAISGNDAIQYDIKTGKSIRASKSQVTPPIIFSHSLGWPNAPAIEHGVPVS
jgi:hypothetical protein